MYVLLTLFTVEFVLYSKYQFKGTSDWHSHGFFMRLIVFVLAWQAQYHPGSFTWKDYVLAGVINVILWELLINKVALGKNWLHVGTTAWTDKFFGMWKWVIMAAALAAAILIKFVF